MMYACQEGREHVVKALLKGGATVDIQDEVIPVITCSVRNSKLPCYQYKL